MKSRNAASLPMNTPDSYEVYTANITPENRNLHLNSKIPIPTIRLTQATPSDTSIPSIIAPKSSPRKKVVPKKSKLPLLSAKGVPPRERDLSDVLRRVNASATNSDGNATCNVTVNGGTTMKTKDLLRFNDRSSRSTIDIYVDPANDPDIGEIVVVKKKKSRAKLDGLFDHEENIKAKEELKEESKWWSLRGRKKERSRNHSLNMLKTNIAEASSIHPEARQRCGSTPLSPSDSGYGNTIALRAMKSLARIGSWAQLKNSLPRDIQRVPSGSRVKSSISSFEVGALSTYTGEDLTNRLSPMVSLRRGPCDSHKFLNPSITNTSVRSRTASCGTMLSTTSTINHLQPNDSRRVSTSSSSGESNRPGSTYTASGEDTGAWDIPAKPSNAKSKKGIGVKWGSVSSALALTKGKKKMEKEILPPKGKIKAKDGISKSDKRFSSPRAQGAKENVPPKNKEDQQRKLTSSHRHTAEGRRRAHIMSVFPGLGFVRPTDSSVTLSKTSMPPIAEDSNRSYEEGSQQQATEKLGNKIYDESDAAVLKGMEKNVEELSDSDSGLWNKDNASDEEACVRISINRLQHEPLRSIVKRNLEADREMRLVKAQLKLRPASEQLLGSRQLTQHSRSVGIATNSDISNIKDGDGQDVLTLSVVEAANSDLASLISRLDLEVTPDKDQDLGSCAETITSWRASGSIAKQSPASKLRSQLETTQNCGEEHSSNIPAECSPSDIRCSVFRENDHSHVTRDIKLSYRDPIAFLDPATDSTLDLSSSAVGESFAFVDTVNGIPPEDSPLRYLGRVRAMSRAMGAVAEAAGETMSKRFSAISASTRASVTSLRPYTFTALKTKDGNVKDLLTKEPQPPSVTTGSFEVDRQCASTKYSIALSARNKQPENLGGPLDGCIAPFSQNHECLSSKKAISNGMSRTSSIASTFGTNAVLAKMHTTRFGELATECTTAEAGRTGGLSETEQASFKYALPSLELADGIPASLYANQFGTEDTPTRSVKARGHARQSSGLVPISERPMPLGGNVRRKVELIEQLALFEQEQEMQKRKRVSRSDVKRIAGANRPSTSSCSSQSSASSYIPNSDEKAEVSTFSPQTQLIIEETIPRSIASVSEDEKPDADILSELKDSLSIDSQHFNDILLPSWDAALHFTSTSGSCTLPPSPGLPPTGPLPIPESQSLRSLIIPTPTLINNFGTTIESSPPAPSLLPVIDPSPSPEMSLPILRVPPCCKPLPSANGGSIPRIVSRSALSLSGSGSDDDTKQSFDFTGELRRINESGGSNRLSFVEQLDAAFKTPPHVTTRGVFSIKTTAAKEPMMSALDAGLDMDVEEGLSMMMESLNESMNNLGLRNPRPYENLASSPTSGAMAPKPSYGRLDTAFKFGGRPGVAGMGESSTLDQELPSVVVSSASQLEPLQPPSISIPTSPVEEDSSILRSIHAHAMPIDTTRSMNVLIPDVSNVSDGRGVSYRPLDFEPWASPGRDIREETGRIKAKLPAHARQSSDTSFLGFSSFGAIRTKFEFGPDRPDFYSPLLASQTSMARSHSRHESLFSIASVSSYGEVIKPGMTDPFNYGSLNEEARNELPGMDSFVDHKRNKRLSTDSDISSFYFRPGDSYSHVRNSILSTNSVNGPPISLYNRTFSQGHRRNDSGGSMSSLAAAYSIQGASGGRAAWMKHRQERSVDSVTSEFSRMRLGRPGVGDKMFESISDPLTSITASPPESVSGDLAQKSSYDSILDEERRSTVDSIFDNTGHRSSMSSDSVFWHDPTNESEQQHTVSQNLLPSISLFRPLSLTSADHGTSREDDTMITMLGGEHVRRRSLGSSFEASPCFRVEKQKREGCHDHIKVHYMHDVDDDDDKGLVVDNTSPTAKIGGGSVTLMRAESTASVKSSKFGETRMGLARNGLLHRESLEDNCLSADGEEASTVSILSRGFSRPAPRRRRKHLVTATQPPDTTPPLSSSDGSGESQSSIDVERLEELLQTAAAGTRSSVSRIRSGARIRAPGQGHRRRASQASKGSVFGTIQEEVSNEFPRRNPVVTADSENCSRIKRDSFKSNSSYSSESLCTRPLDFEMTKSPDGNDLVSNETHIAEHQNWNEEQWVVVLRRYYTLRSEADEEIRHSHITWPDTPFSLHALQTFVPPRDPAVMQALLEHSVKNYLPLPIDRHPRRIRSRASSISKSSLYSRPNSSGGSGGGSARLKKSHARSRSKSSVDSCTSSANSSILQPKCVNSNRTSPQSMLADMAPFSPFAVLGQTKDRYLDENNFVAFSSLGNGETAPLNIVKPDVRPRVPSATRRTALGWSKRKTTKDEGKSNKENEAHGLLVSPSESLRIVRPRPRSRIINGHANVALRPVSLLLS